MLELATPHLEVLRALDKFIYQRCKYGDEQAINLEKGHFMQTSTYFTHHSTKRRGAHPYQFQVFRHSILFKFYFHIVFALALLAPIQFIGVTAGYELLEFFQGYFTLKLSGASYSELTDYASSLFKKVTTLGGFSELMMVLLTSQGLFFFTDLIIMRTSSKLKLKPSHWHILLTLTLLVLTGTYQITSYNYIEA